MEDYQEIRRLPTAHAAAVGRIIVRWSYLEYILNKLICKLADVKPKQARVVVRDLRARDYISMFRLLMKIRKIQISEKYLNHLPSELREMEERRNLIVHGAWLQHPQHKYICLWNTRGTWQSGPLQGTSRRIKPEAEKVNPWDLIADYKKIDAIIRRLQLLETNIKSALVSSA